MERYWIYPPKMFAYTDAFPDLRLSRGDLPVIHFTDEDIERMKTVADLWDAAPIEFDPLTTGGRMADELRQIIAAYRGQADG